MGPTINLAVDRRLRDYRCLRQPLITVHESLRGSVGGPPHHQHKLPYARCQNVPHSLSLSALIQSICLVIYCTSPILILSFVIFIIRLFWHSFILNICLSVFAVTFTVRGAQLYFRELVREDKKYLVLYPVILFYVFLATYMSMA